MKKASISILLFFTLIGLMACSNDNAGNQNGTEDSKAEENAADQESIDVEDVDIEMDDKKIEKKEAKEVKSVTKQIVSALATGKIDEDFYDHFSDRQVDTINHMLQDGTDEEIAEEELTEKFLHTYVQLSDRVEAFLEENGELDKVVITQVNKDELELEETTQETMEIEAQLVTKEEEKLPLNILLDVNDGEYEYAYIDSPRT